MNQKMAMHIAFEAARYIESEPRVGLGRFDTFIDPDVDDSGIPFILISVSNEGYEFVSARVPDELIIRESKVNLIVKPLSMRLN